MVGRGQELVGDLGSGWRQELVGGTQQVATPARGKDPGARQLSGCLGGALWGGRGWPGIHKGILSREGAVVGRREGAEQVAAPRWGRGGE